VRNRDQADNQYFRMTVFIALASMAALIALHIDDYIGNGFVFLLIPLILCAALLAICIPLMKYLRKISKGDSEAGYFQAANLFAVFSMVSFILVRLPEYISSALYFRAVVLLAACLSVIGSMLFLMTRVRSPAFLAFYIPAITFALYTLGTVILGGTSYYFLTYLIICGFGALYTFYDRYRNFIILSHLIILCMVLMKIPILGPGMSNNTTVLHWILSIYAANFFLMLSRFSTEKSSRSKRAQNAFDTLMAATPNLLVMVDEMNRVTYISKPLAKLARIEDYEMAAGRPVIDLFYDINTKLVIGEIVESDGYYEGALELFFDNKKRYFKITSGKLPSQISGRFIDMSDITPIMEARYEAEEAKARAEEANSAKSAFLARMSHEIRTPMNAITGMSELILREQASPAVYEYAAAVKQAGNNLVAIINDILDFSKIESGKLEIVPAEYEFSSLINDVIAIIRMRLREKPICFAVNVDSTVPRKLYGDVVRVRQILLNLLSNAAKYTPRGHIIFAVSVEEEEEKSLVLKFEIVDTGIGIKPRDMGRLFDNFSRLDSQVNQGVEGSGLGLVITRSLCCAMGGDVTVESEYGAGSIFTAYIPQGIRDRAPWAALADPAAKRALVYETREVYGNSLALSMDNLGAPCRLAAGKEEFVRALETDRFDFIFAASSLFDEAWAEIQKRGIGAALVLLAEYGETAAGRPARVIAMPAHALSIANILNGVEEPRGYDENNTGARFTAPEARVLVVDDIKTNLDVAKGLLAPYAMRVDTCLGGKEALALAQENQYDLILMDHMMPGMDGIEAARAIRALPGEYFQQLPIVVLTANAIAGMQDMFLGAGFNGYISKPIEIAKLDEIITRWVPAGKRVKAGKGNPREAAVEKPGMLIEGLDTQKGIMMTGGTEEGYREVLAQFRQDIEERLPVFSEVPAGGALADFTIQAHAIKSAAGTIGAAKVSAEAAALEAAGKAGDTEAIGKALAGFREHLTELIKIIDHYSSR
jgi:signal transduction histidine kinase/FixJ family two-component response regulator/HPt (histidine-containing phosphotransfer) domain-containing protein